MNASNPLAGVLGLWLTFQLVTTLISALATLYALFCLGKTAAAIDRLAVAVETMVERQGAPSLPMGSPSAGGAPVAFAPLPAVPVNAPVPAMPPVQTVGETTPAPSNVPYVPRREVMP